MNKIVERIKENQKRNFEYTLLGTIPIFVKDQITNGVNIEAVISELEKLFSKIPKNLVNSIIVGHHPLFDKRKINAFYLDKNIYISNIQDNIADMIDDIVHEYAHVIEEAYYDEIYGDGEIEKEFLSKRLLLKQILKHYDSDALKYDFEETEYNKEFDNYLHNVVTYEKINNLTNYGLFINPYAATSLREYFATGFENYVLGSFGLYVNLHTMCPALIEKIMIVVETKG